MNGLFSLLQQQTRINLLGLAQEYGTLERCGCIVGLAAGSIAVVPYILLVHLYRTYFL